MRLVLAALALLAATPSALAATPSVPSPVGEWLVKDKTGRVEIQPCGANLCGHLSWSSDGKDVGAAILIDMKPDGARWTGTVVDVRYGLHYLAHIQLKSPDKLRLDGCIAGGLICSGEVWTRYGASAAPPG